MKFLVKKSPDNFIKSVNDEISSILNRNFDSFFPEYILNENLDEKYAMPVEIMEKDNEYSIKAELPWVKKEESKKEDTKGFRKSEFKYGEFTRTVYFPQEINVDKTTAKLENGILHIDAPKLVIEKQDKKKLQIQ